MSEELNRFFKSISFSDDAFNEALLDRVVFKKGENKFLVYIKNKNVLLNTSKNLYASIFDFTDPWKIDILEFLESNYMNDISMEEIANYTGRSLSTFKRDFKKCSTLSPREWLIRRRLEAARELIRKGGRKVSDICFEVGFKNLSHFSKIYKETYGIPPTEDTQPGISLA